MKCSRRGAEPTGGNQLGWHDGNDIESGERRATLRRPLEPALRTRFRRALLRQLVGDKASPRTRERAAAPGTSTGSAGMGRVPKGECAWHASITWNAPVAAPP
jgi:hypothetical protein